MRNWLKRVFDKVTGRMPDDTEGHAESRLPANNNRRAGSSARAPVTRKRRMANDFAPGYGSRRNGANHHDTTSAPWIIDSGSHGHHDCGTPDYGSSGGYDGGSCGGDSGGGGGGGGD